jgi:type I restriction enzyme M protein
MPLFTDMLSGIKENDIIRFSVADAVEECWNALRLIYGVYNVKTMAAFILNSETTADSRRYSITITPSSVITLALEILKISDADKVADLGTGFGSFLVSAYKENSNAEYYAVEIHNGFAAIAAIKAELLGQNVKVEQGNMFSISNLRRKFSKVFANYPFGIKSTNAFTPFVEALDYNLPKSRSSDWLFNLLALESLGDNGKAIGIMTCGACFNSADREMREFFIRNGYIEAIIALPDRLFADIGIATEMIVLSKGNKAIRMVDASKLCKKGRRQSEFTDEHIRKIVTALDADTDYSRLVLPTELEEVGYNLDPTKKLEKPIKIKNGVCFGDVIKNITRGSQLNADTLDEITSAEPTSYQYLMLRDIQDGIISEQLPFLKYIEPRLEKYCIASGNLVMSKNGAPFKVAVVGEMDCKSVLANGNLYVIELDESKIRPHYLKAFFESEIGAKTLSIIAVGTAMPIIQVEALKSITIPCPPLDEQVKLETQYLQSVESIRSLKSQLSSAIEASKNFFKEED